MCVQNFGHAGLDYLCCYDYFEYHLFLLRIDYMAKHRMIWAKSSRQVAVESRGSKELQVVAENLRRYQARQ